jgi:hypothetical protein
MMRLNRIPAATNTDAAPLERAAFGGVPLTAIARIYSCLRRAASRIRKGLLNQLSLGPSVVK